MSSTANLSSLVNEHNLRGTIKRLFLNNPYEILGELFQNSQRAGASRVDIETDPDAGYVSIQDNGSGLRDLADFHTLLRFAESGYSEEVQRNQHPMGVGIHSLFAHSAVLDVTLSSGHISLTIDAKRWWDDPGYYSTWFERVNETSEFVQGLRIEIHANRDLVLQVQNGLPMDSKRWVDKSLPCLGYEGMLEIIHNGHAVMTGLPDAYQMDPLVIETTYMGNKVQIGRMSGLTSYHDGDLLVNWYGQLVTGGSFRLDRDLWKVYLEVREGRPVNPKAPTRQGLINDEALNAFRQFIVDTIFAFVCDEANFSRITPTMVASLYTLDRTRAYRECPYFTASRWLDLNTRTSGEYSLDEADAAKIYRYADGYAHMLFLEQGVSVLRAELEESDDDRIRQYDNGLTSFLREAGVEAFELGASDPGRFDVKYLWWKPSSLSLTPKHPHEPVRFFGLGHWALGDLPDAPPSEEAWVAFGEDADAVFAYTDGDSYDVHETDFVAGTTNPVQFLQDWARCMWYPDEDDWDKSEECFDETVDAWCRELLGTSVRVNFDYTDLRQLFVPQLENDAKYYTVEVTRVDYELKNGQPTHVTVHANGMEPVRALLYGS